MRRKGLLLAGVLALALATAALCGGCYFHLGSIELGRTDEEIQRDDYLDSLHDAAAAEGQMLVWISNDEDELFRLCKNFVDEEKLQLSYKVIAPEEALAELTANPGQPPVDLWLGVDLATLAQLRDEGYLGDYDAYLSDNLLSDRFREAGGGWYGAYLYPVGIMADRKALRRANLPLPQEWQDLLDPVYAGAVALPNPESNGGRTLLATLALLMGEAEAQAYLDGLAANGAVYTKGEATPSNLIASGEAMIAVGDLSGGVQHILNGDALELIVPESGSGGRLATVALLKDCAHPQFAARFIEFTLQGEWFSQLAAGNHYPLAVTAPAEQPYDEEETQLDFTRFTALY